MILDRTDTRINIFFIVFVMLNHVNFLDEIVIMFFPCTFICDIVIQNIYAER